MTKNEPSAEVRHWLGEITDAKKREKDFRKNGREVIEIYAGDKPSPGIYMLVNLLDGRVYVGQSSDIWKRCSQHFASLRRNDHRNIRMQRAYLRDGEAAFQFIIVENCDICDLDSRESYWIKVTPLTYNICPVGTSSRGIKRSPEVCKKLSDAKRGKQPAHLMLPEVRARAAKTHALRWDEIHDRVQSVETVSKRITSLRARWSGTPKKSPSEEGRAKMSASAKRRVTPGNVKLTTAQILAIFNSHGTIKEVSFEYGIGTSQVHRIRTGQSWGSVTGG